MNGLRDLATLAADDAAVEAEIGDGETRYALHLYAAEWDAAVEEQEELANRQALALPTWFVPATVVLLVIIIFAWGV